ncbi:hypothetical protein UFOVP635_29 [uncultured Caudovirales phage]|uniref:Uncharacterized protein n=1 Tax=uncultured Caudovirales phage TaxID=2100421 RepID=A0A6J5N4S2_9CAUD|nr:hypothetical protein UFOVP635_29 [uncultured Caudovirales phage]
MRTELLSYLTATITSSTFKVSTELPWSSGVPLYVKNPKKVYVDMEQKSTEQVMAVLGNHGIFQQVDTLNVYLVTDAKNIPNDYASVVSLIEAGKNVASNEPYFKREVDSGITFEGDLMITQLEFRFTKLT